MRVLPRVALLAALFACVGVAYAETVACQRAIAKATSRLVHTHARALARCRDAVLAGKLAPATDCDTEAKTAVKLANAEAKLRQEIDRKCGGDDRICGGGDDDSLASIGWDAGTCPGLDEAGCDNAISDCGDVADCLVCVGNAAVDQLLANAAGSADLASESRSTLEKCQRTLAKATGTYAALRSKAQRQCWDSVAKNGSGSCPDSKATDKLTKARDKLAAKLCRMCGGADRGCDGDIGSTTGTGGSDDLTPIAIGFAATCPDVTPPDQVASCAGPIAGLADLVTCVECVARFDTDCADRLAVPWATPYPQSCAPASVAEPPTCNEVIYAEDFTGNDADPWPSPWTPIGSVDTAAIQSNRARFRPTLSGYSLARLFADVDTTDVEVLLTMEFEDIDTQGIGFYVRQNGGYLEQSPTHGEGYAVFVEGFRFPQQIGVWREINGSEQQIANDGALPFVLSNDVSYRVRFHVHQEDANTTRLRARIWIAGNPEPLTWNVDTTDATPSLQNVTGGIAADSWTSLAGEGSATAYTLIDDVEIRGLCNPIAALGSATSVASGYSFLEGPRWRPDDDELLFTDLDHDTIYRLEPPNSVSVFRTPSAGANGLANDINGELLACEHTDRRVSRTSAGGVISTVTDNFMGMRYNSPNDLVVRSDGTIYFTDPHYGLANPGDREIAFNGLFRLPSGGNPVAEWEGDAVTDGPNGVDLSPDESTLYLANSQTGEVRAFDVAVDGSLSNERTFASGMTIPDGMCVDVVGNIYVATWLPSLEIFAPNGNRWGSIPLASPATNCAFGGADGQTLYVTTQPELLAFPTTIPGIY